MEDIYGQLSHLLDAIFEQLTSPVSIWFVVASGISGFTCGSLYILLNRLQRTSWWQPQHRREFRRPPRAAEFLLCCCLPKEDRETLIGDLEEEYQTKIFPKFGARKARIWYWCQAVRSIAPLVRNLLIKSSFGTAAVGAAAWVWEKLGR
jgi:hypothetical protein